MDIYLSNPDAESVVSAIEHNGVAVVRNYVRGETLDALRGEFHQIMTEARSGSKGYIAQGKSEVERLFRGLDRKRYPVCSQVFYSDFMNDIARAYHGPHPYELNGQLYLTHDREVMDFNSAWHLDPSRCLKFMLYLDDTTTENGAMMYAPGSHYQGFFRIMYYRQRGIDDFPNFLPENEVPKERVSLEGPAGTMLIFEACGIHRAGVLKSGTERRVIRGHTLPKTSRIGQRLRRLVRALPWNIARYKLVEDEKVSDRFKTRAIRM